MPNLALFIGLPTVCTVATHLPSEVAAEPMDPGRALWLTEIDNARLLVGAASDGPRTGGSISSRSSPRPPVPDSRFGGGTLTPGAAIQRAGSLRSVRICRSRPPS